MEAAGGQAAATSGEAAKPSIRERPKLSHSRRWSTPAPTVIEARQTSGLEPPQSLPAARARIENAPPQRPYKLAFETPAGTDYGVAYLHDGRLRGGDGGMAYVGSYRVEGPLFSAEMSVTQHRHLPGAVSALGLNDGLVQLQGVLDDSSVLTPRGISPETSMVRFTARLSQIAEYAERRRSSAARRAAGLQTVH